MSLNNFKGSSNSLVIFTIKINDLVVLKIDWIKFLCFKRCPNDESDEVLYGMKISSNKISLKDIFGLAFREANVELIYVSFEQSIINCQLDCDLLRKYFLMTALNGRFWGKSSQKLRTFVPWVSFFWDWTFRLVLGFSGALSKCLRPLPTKFRHSLWTQPRSILFTKTGLKL